MGKTELSAELGFVRETAGRLVERLRTARLAAGFGENVGEAPHAERLRRLEGLHRKSQELAAEIVAFAENEGV